MNDEALALVAVRRSAEAHAITEHARGRGAEQRAWLDLLVLIDQAERKVAALVAQARSDALRGIRFSVEAACDGYASLQPSDVPEDIWDEDSYTEGARDAAEAIRAAAASSHPTGNQP